MKLRKPLVVAVTLSMLAVGPALAQQGKKGAKGGPKGATSAASASSMASATPPGMGTDAATAASGAATTTAAAGATATTMSSTMPPGTGAGVAATAPTQIDGQTYAVRLRDLEQRVDELKEQIRRSHTRLSLLSDTVLSAGAQGSKADISFQNDMSSAFRLTRALFVLDGAVQYNKADESGALSEQPVIPIFSGSIPPGDHTMQVYLQLQGNGYGVFSYLKGYKFEVRSTHSFKAVEGKTTAIQAIAYEQGGVTTPLEERPHLRFVSNTTSGLSGGGATPASSGGAAPIATSVSIGAGGTK
jgi:hypothetical protein